MGCDYCRGYVGYPNLDVKKRMVARCARCRWLVWRVSKEHRVKRHNKTYPRYYCKRCP